jgi:uncharacterized protein YodC (DUF2158 family)
MTTSTQEITIGSVVRLKSGGPLMTVCRLYTLTLRDEGVEAAQCEWFEQDRWKGREIPKTALEVVAPELVVRIKLSTKGMIMPSTEDLERMRAALSQPNPSNTYNPKLEAANNLKVAVTEVNLAAKLAKEAGLTVDLDVPSKYGAVNQEGESLLSLSVKIYDPREY